MELTQDQIGRQPTSPDRMCNEDRAAIAEMFQTVLRGLRAKNDPELQREADSLEKQVQDFAGQQKESK